MVVGVRGNECEPSGRGLRQQKHGKAASGSWPRSLPLCSFPTPLSEGRKAGSWAEALFPSDSRMAAVLLLLMQGPRLWALWSCKRTRFVHRNKGRARGGALPFLAPRPVARSAFTIPGTPSLQAWPLPPQGRSGQAGCPLWLPSAPPGDVCPTQRFPLHRGPGSDSWLLPIPQPLWSPLCLSTGSRPGQRRAVRARDVPAGHSHKRLSLLRALTCLFTPELP